LLVLLLLGLPSPAADKLEFNRDIRPILADNCFPCHGPDKAARKAGLRLDRREEAIDLGAIVPGKPDESDLVRRILSTEAKELMPPAKSRKKLTAAQKDALKRWVTAGAEYQPHWSLIAPKRPQLLAVRQAGWVRNPIDQFILAELEKQGLQPTPEADRRTLARRLSLDLTGLPPEPEAVDRFVADASTDAYERYVDRLLKSPHWGEHRGRYWLDAARYADTHGIHFDNYREIWSYRDWVIGAFNRNQRFDQFTIEQLAGDLLPNRTMDQAVASGFNRCNITTNEGGAISEEYLVFYTRDRTETTSKVWLGLTANCAVCHDHKFDPLTTREFYSMAAFFNNTTQDAMDGNIKDTPPVIRVPRPDDRLQYDAVAKQLAEIRQQIDARKGAGRAEFSKWVAGAKHDRLAAMIPGDALRFQAALSEGTGKTVHVNVEGKTREIALQSGFDWDAGYVATRAFRCRPGGVLETADAGDLERDKGFSFGAWVRLPNTDGAGAIFARMDNEHDYRGWDLWVENGKVGTHIINTWPSDALKVVTRVPISARQWHHVFVTYDGSSKVAGVKVYVDGVPQEPEIQADALRSTIRTKVPLKIGQRHSMGRINNLMLQDARIYGRTLSGTEVEGLARATRAAGLLAKPADKRSPPEQDELFDWWLAAFDQPSQALTARQTALRLERTEIEGRSTVAHVMQERTQMPTAYVLYRGEYDKRRDAVKPATPAVLPPMPAELPRNRLGLAQWLLRPEHPLTARVTVNRFWQEVFGTGIVRTTEDFGISGELPSHPELLDWLAVEFRESGWDVKRFFKLLVMSATYRQAARTTSLKLEKDPSNRLLSRGPRFRMDAESIRDYALAASGLLSQEIGGPSVKPYQPEGVWEAVAIIGSDTRDYKADQGDKLYRRSMYTFWKRSAPPASMEIFNAPNRETCTVRRERTNTPLQALVTLNDPQFVEAARFLAEKTLKAANQPGTQLEFMAKRLLSRPLRAEEANVVEATLKDLLGFYQSHSEEAKKLISVGDSKPDPKVDVGTLAAWTMLANQLLNLDEVLNK
jgi:hypothetical protein